jgi:hypothetical protein
VLSTCQTGHQLRMTLWEHFLPPRAAIAEFFAQLHSQFSVTFLVAGECVCEATSGARADGEALPLMLHFVAVLGCGCCC